MNHWIGGIELSDSTAQKIIIVFMILWAVTLIAGILGENNKMKNIFDVVAVDMANHKIELMAEKKTASDAEAIEMMVER